MSYRFATRLLHEAFPPDKATGATTSSICQTAAYAQETAEDMAKVFAGKNPGLSIPAWETRRLPPLSGGLRHWKKVLGHCPLPPAWQRFPCPS